jgi:twitching motility protein PilT
MAKIDELFKIMVEQGASDLHLSAGAPPILRLHG